MRNYTVCILDNDIHYAKAFMKVVAAEHADFSVGTRSSCGGCRRDEVDVCIGFGAGGGTKTSCEKAFEPGCGKFSGVAAILSEARRFVLDRETAGAYTGKQRSGKTGREDSPLFAGGAFICVFAFAGGLGTSCAAIGIGRELARYRGEQVLYLSLEDAEDTGLFPAGLHAMRAEETLYRYLRLSNTGGGQEGFAKLFRAAAARDEYGLYRLAPDEGAGSLAGLTPGELYSFLSQAFISLGLTRIVLDLGTRLNFIKTFTRVLAAKEALFIEVRPDGENQGRNSRSLFTDDQPLNAAFPVCDEDIRRKGDHTDVGLANAFGLAVKEICDRITEDAT